MAHDGVAEAETQFIPLFERVEDEERIIITRDGKLIVEIVKAAASAPPKPVSAEAIAAALERLSILRESLPPADMPAADMIREMRDEGV